jgi:rod shape-determining protein MreD
MSEVKHHLIWVRRLTLVFIAALIMFYHLIPFKLTPATFPSPDIMFGIICALIIRRPEIVPFWLIGIIYFGFDIFLMKPLGIWAICVLVATEAVRANRAVLRENLFPFEWFMVSLIFLATLLANRVFWVVSFIPTPSWPSLFWQFLFTVAAYPVILFVMTYILHIRKPALGTFGMKGQKL